jgi:hypothetical protein
MINKKTARMFCKEDISKIENYEQAINNKSQTWDCHHRDEVKILPCGIEVRRSTEELIENGRYFDCPANELIFLTRAEHNKLHHKGNKYSIGYKNRLGKHLSEESKSKIGKANKGNNYTRGKPKSEFGNKFKEHYGITRFDDVKLYDREWHWYNEHNKKCRWE